MPLGEALALRVFHQGAVIPERRLEAQRLVEKHLAGGGPEEISAADDLRDAHGGIVDYAGELIGRYAVAPPDQEVSEVVAGDEALGSEVLVMKFDGASIGYSEAPVDAGGGVLVLAFARSWRVWQRPAGSGIVGALVVFIFVRSADHRGEVFAAAPAGIEISAITEGAPGGEIVVAALALAVRAIRPSEIVSFLPFDSQPVQVFDHGVDELGPRTLRVEIFVAQDEDALRVAGADISGKEGAGVAEVEESGG